LRLWRRTWRPTIPLLVNGEVVADDLIRDETTKLRNLPGWADEEAQGDGKLRMRAAAEDGAIARVLLRQAVEQDRQALNPTKIEGELLKDIQSSGRRPGVAQDTLRKQIEFSLRTEQTVMALVGRRARPREKDLIAFYRKHRPRFTGQELISASHILKRVNKECPDEQARRVMESAIAELERG